MPQLVATSDPRWLPVVLTPFALAGWLVLIWLMLRRSGAPGPLGRRIRVVRFLVTQRLGRRRRLARARERQRRMDERFSSDSTPPGDERIGWTALWMVEVYTSAHADALLRGARRLGWDSDRIMRSDAVDWMRSVRATGALHWTRPGFFRPREGALFPTAVRADIPGSFAYLHPLLVQLGPGVTALVAQFALAEDEVESLDRVLRAPADGRIEALGWTGYRSVPADQVKAERLGSERARIRGAAAGWIAANLPGLFSAAGELPPTWDLIATEHASLDGTGARLPDWRSILGLDRAELWSAGADTELALALPTFRRPSDARPTFTGRRRALIGDLGPGHGDSMYSVAQDTDELVAPLLGLWGLVHAVESLDHRLNRARDTQLSDRSTVRAARRQLTHMRDVVLPAVDDLEVIHQVADRLETEDARAWFRFMAGDLYLQDERDQLTLSDWLRRRLSEGTAAARVRAASYATAIRALSETLVAGSNLGLQRRVFWLSIAVAAMTGVTVWAAIRELDLAEEDAKRHDPPPAAPR